MAGDYCKIFINSTLVPGVLNVNIDDGRRNETDPFRGGTATFDYLQKFDGSPNIVPQIGDLVDITLYIAGGVEQFLFRGNIADIDYLYNVAQINTYRVTVTDAISQIAQAEVSNVSVAPDYTGNQIKTLLTAAGISYPVGNIERGYSLCSGYTYTGNLLDQINKITTTEQGILLVDPSGVVAWKQRNVAIPPIISYSFSFTEGVQQYRYDQVDVASAVQNRFNYVIVTPDGLASTPSSKPVVGAKKSLSVPTLDATTTQAGYLADYLWGMYSNADQDVQMVSTTIEAQNITVNKQTLATLQLNTVVSVGYTPGTGGAGFIIGRSISGTPSGTRFTYYLSGVSLQPFLRLDNVLQGKLDSGRLGF